MSGTKDGNCDRELGGYIHIGYILYPFRNFDVIRAIYRDFKFLEPKQRYNNCGKEFVFFKDIKLCYNIINIHIQGEIIIYIYI